ncbi:MAG: transposase family protein [Nitrospira sp.]|nr:transposase family protein [Nitrospira sp.]MBX3349032.1 transposase family protein [Nitrospira sp.]
MTAWLIGLLVRWRRFLQWVHQSLVTRVRHRRRGHRCPIPTPRRVFAQPKPTWVREEIIRLKALMPEAGCRTIAHTFNRQWRDRRQMTVSKTYVADTCRKHQYEILHARQKLKHRVPRPMRRNRVWGCDLLTKTDQHGTQHIALAIVDHGSRACLRLQALSDKSSIRLLQELVQAVQRYGRPQYLRTDNEAVLVSRLFRFGLWLLGIRHQRIQPGCPWQNGRVERFIGTVKRELRQEVLTSRVDLEGKLTTIREWYNHDRPHDHLQGRTPAEVWAGIDVFAAKLG